METGASTKTNRGLSNVLVTDGEHVRHTNDDGTLRFTFEMPDEPHCRFVVATRPTGFQPTSQPVLRIRFDVAETQYRADFGFVDDPSSNRTDFSFITASDSQFTQPGEMIATAKDYAQITSAAVVAQRLSVARSGGPRQARNHPHELPKVDGPLHQREYTLSAQLATSAPTTGSP